MEDTLNTELYEISREAAPHIRRILSTVRGTDQYPLDGVTLPPVERKVTQTSIPPRLRPFVVGYLRDNHGVAVKFTTTTRTRTAYLTAGPLEAE
jgi:hypothetical protein